DARASNGHRRTKSFDKCGEVQARIRITGLKISDSNGLSRKCTRENPVVTIVPFRPSVFVAMYVGIVPEKVICRNDYPSVSTMFDMLIRGFSSNHSSTTR